jgi:alpha-2-macroglobulin
MIKSRRSPAFVTLLFLIFSLGFVSSVQVQESWNGNFADGWRQFEQLTKDQKYEAASSLVEKMLASARDQKNGTEWPRCLIRYTQLRMALHGYETSVRFLKDQAWPEDLKGSSVLNLYYAQALTIYARSYSYEINKRERMDSKSAVDLKAWTRDQIYEEAQKAFENVWTERNRLGDMPVSDWKEFIAPNSYPAGIRPTLRDAVSYLRVETLADTNGWQPDQLNELYRLNLKKLIAGEVGNLSLVDPARHPLEKISLILTDLQNWHVQKGELEAALEARLELYRQLHQRFTEQEDRTLIQSQLENQLEAIPNPDLPWLSEAMAQLAEFARMDNDPNSLVRARQISIKGQRPFPDSVGGKHCFAIEKSIEFPDFSVSGMQNDNPQKKSILVTHKNLERIYFRAYAIDLLKTIEASKDYNLLPTGKDLDQLIANSAPAEQWGTALPATPDYRTHKTFVVPPMSKPGTYLVIASARPGFQKSDNKLQGLYMTIGDLAMATRQALNNLEVTILSGSSGDPIGGVEVILYRYDYNKLHQPEVSKLTDRQGIVQFQIDVRNSSYFLVARKGDQLAFDPQHLVFQDKPASQSSGTLLFTDRSIYRPLQKVLWKAVAYTRLSDGTRFETSSETTFTLTLKDMNRQVVESKVVKTNNYGTASGEFVIPAGRALGQWFLESSRGGQAGVRIEEYKRPTFEARMMDPEEPLRLNKPALIKGEVKYYFGLPVSSGKVKWIVRRAPVFPWWWGYYSWGNTSYNVSHVIAGGDATLNADGTYSFTFAPTVDERLGKIKDVTYRYSVSADVTDEGGETRSAQRSFRLGFVSIEATAVLEKSFFLKDKPINITIQRSSLDGIPRAGNGIWKITALKEPLKTLLPAEQPYLVSQQLAEKGYQTPGDLERERWRPAYNPEAVWLQWEEGNTRASGAVVHDEKGEGKIAISSLSPGAYRLTYETTDDFGAKCELQKYFIVAASSLQLAMPAMLLAEDTSVKVGGTARFLAHSGFKDQLMVFEVYRDGKCIQRKELHSDKDSSVMEIPITEQDRGGLGIRLSVLRDNQFIALQSSVMVPWDNKELRLEFSTFRDRLRPGQQESWSVKIKDSDGKDVAASAAELLAYMYDCSLDAFVPHNPVRPISLYPYRGRLSTVRSNLSESRMIGIGFGFLSGPAAPSFLKDRLAIYSGYAIGGVGVRTTGMGGGIGGGVTGGVAGAILGEVRVIGEAVSADQIAKLPLVNNNVMDLVKVMGGAVYTNLNQVFNSDQNTIAGLTASPLPGSRIELRSEFSETAFWQPHLLTGLDGSVTFEFKVPDSVTSWNVWVHAITRDFKSGSAMREARSVKELMVRPYLPRFLREGDQAEIKVAVNNASDHELKGALHFDIIDVATDQSVLSDFGLSKSDVSRKAFTISKSGAANLAFPIKTPSKVGQIAFKVTATSGDFSDGELRPIPILPGRMHLMQSRFVTLKDPGRRVIRFDDLARNNDPTRINEQMVVTLDAQLFYSVLSALPYLVNYPYECTEQTLNRFVSTGILSSLYRQYPAIERMTNEFSSRQTQFEQWDAADPNRKMALEETPWIEMAKGGDAKSSDLINVLDSRIAKAQRESALAKLRQSQTSSGGFPWFAGGAPSPYMTLYLLHGFSKALEFGVEVPREMVKPAWDYMHRHYLDDLVKDMMGHDLGWETVTFINYVLSNYPDNSWYKDSFTPAERQTMLNFSYKHWRKHSPYLKGYLALTLKRMGRPKDAMLVWESVMDSAKTAEDQGTFWAPEDRGWLWYNDTIETHAFAIRTDMELIPNDSKLDGMVLWLFLNKKMNHWKSTRATAEVIYSLAHYLKESGQLGLREDATVTIGNQKTAFVFEPDQYTGKKNQIVIPGEKINPQTTSSVTVEKTSKGHLFASATWHFSTEQLPEEERGDYLKLSRSYFKRVNTGKEFILQPLQEGAALAPGDEVEVHLSLTSKHAMEYVHLRDPRAAGFEPVSNLSKHKWDLGISWYEEIRDSGTNFFFEHLPQGEYTFKYRIRAATAGTFKVAPATAQPMYAPEFAAYSSGAILKIF